jgi:hypothetical protein
MLDRKGRTLADVRLSVGVPSYNQGRWIRATIESLLNQRVPAAEIVVSDNHSTDETPRILGSFGGRIRVVNPPRHLTMPENWNFLCSRLEGDWISLLSSDDVARSDYVKKLVLAASSANDAVLVRGNYQRIDAEGNPGEVVHIKGVRRMTGPPENLLQQIRAPKSTFAGFALRKEAWVRAGGFREDMSLMMDWAMWLMVSPFGSFIHVPEVICDYRSDYRPGIRLERMRARLADEVIIAREVVPKAAAAMGIADDRRIRASSRRRLWGVFHDASCVVEAHRREEYALLLADWSNEVGLDRLLTRFMEGRYIPKRPGFIQKIKDIFRGRGARRPR